MELFAKFICNCLQNVYLIKFKEFDAMFFSSAIHHKIHKCTKDYLSYHYGQVTEQLPEASHANK